MFILDAVVRWAASSRQGAMAQYDSVICKSLQPDVCSVMYGADRHVIIPKVSS